MLNAKVLLGAVAALGIVGSVFAFKVYQGQTVYTRAAGTTICEVPVSPATLTPNAFPIVQTHATTLPGVCPAVRTLYIGD